MPERAKSYFHWNLGGLLGCALGTSAWMVVTPLASGWPLEGTIGSLLAAALIFATALVLWSKRDRIAALTGVLILLGTALVVTTAWLLLAHGQGLGIISKWPGGTSLPALSLLWVLLLYPALAAWFLFLDKARRPAKKSSS